MHGLVQCFPAARQHSFQYLTGGKLRLRLARLDRVLRGYARHGQDRALGGLHDRLVCGLHAFAQRKRQLAAARFLGLMQFFRHAAEQQRKDDARVAARPAQQRRGSRIHRLCERRLRQLFQLGHSRRHGHGHVGARIAVRHREHVQLVDLFLLFGNGERALDHHRPEQRAVYFLICHLQFSLTFSVLRAARAH